MKIILVAITGITLDDNCIPPPVEMVKMEEGDFNAYCELLEKEKENFGKKKDEKDEEDEEDEGDYDDPLYNLKEECLQRNSHKVPTHYATISTYYGSYMLYEVEEPTSLS